MDNRMSTQNDVHQNDVIQFVHALVIHCDSTAPMGTSKIVTFGME